MFSVVITSILLTAAACSSNAEDEAAGAKPPTTPEARDVETSTATLPNVNLSPAYPNLSFIRPVLLTHAGDGTDRVFVVEQIGRIRVFANDNSVEEAGVFLDLRDVVLAPPKGNNEEGLLALAFHPKYKENGRFFVYYSVAKPRRGVLAEFSVSKDDPDVADPASAKVILEVEQPYGNHNGSSVNFGPDGMLYYSLGDGGWANDPHDHGQNLGTLLGTIMRIDVDTQDEGRAYAIPADNPFVGREGARGEIWAYGLRNIWRMAFDPETGELWAADVGQNAWEEVDLIVKGGNYGWNIREGAHDFKDGTPTTTPMIDPIVEYPRREGVSITGGYVYRGNAIEALKGAYVYGDYASGKVWAVRAKNGKLAAHREILVTDNTRYIASFGEDRDGEMYICAFDGLDGRRGGRGRIFKIVKALY
jgi:glucose/arabinose dehydrogenase